MAELIRGVVARVDDNGFPHVTIAALGGEQTFGPCEVVTDKALAVAGARVLCAIVNGVPDDVVVVGVVSPDGPETPPVTPADLDAWYAGKAPNPHSHPISGVVGLEAALANATPTGVINAFAGAAAPSGFLLCDGSVVSRTTYAALFAVIGTTYGAGDGSTTFALPDLRVRVPVGAGTGKALGSSEGLGETGRNARWSHSHSHTASGSTDYNSSLSVTGYTDTQGSSAASVSVSVSGTVGNGGAHSHGTGGPSQTVQGASGTAIGPANGFHTHNTGTEPAHSHSWSGSASGTVSTSHSHSLSGSTGGHSHGVSVSVGSGGPAEHPFLAVNYIIKT